MVKYAKPYTDVNSLENPVTREEAGAAVNLLQQTLDDQTKKTEQLVRAVATAHARADATENIAGHNVGEIAQSNADLALVVRDLHVEVQTMRANIVNAETRADEARKAAEDASTQQAKVAQGLQQAKQIIEVERKLREQQVWRSMSNIGKLKMELAYTQEQVQSQSETATDLRGLLTELQQTKAKVQAQHAEIAGLEKFSDEMMEQILEFTDVFHQIDQQDKTGETELRIGEKGMGERLLVDVVQSLYVKEPIGHAQSGLPVFNLQTTFEEESKD